MTTHRSVSSLPAAFGAALLLLAGAAGAAPPDRDAGVQAVVGGVSAARLENTVRTLASFPTRHTLSPAGSARAVDWIAAQFQAISAATGGRLRVERDTWMQPVGECLPARPAGDSRARAVTGRDGLQRPSEKYISPAR